MNFTDNRPANSGDTKLSEIAVDRQLPLFDTSTAQENALISLEVAFRAILNTARKTNYILRSEGQIEWTGSEIRFDAIAMANSIDLDILATEGNTNHSFTIHMQGSTIANAPSNFLNLPLNDGDLLYMELDPTLLVDTGSYFNIDNAVNGGGTTVGLRLLKQPITTAMPKLTIGSSGAGSLFYIPLAMRRGTNILWIPHGILWPAGSTSQLGAVIVSGFDAWPERFVTSQAELISALSDLSALGGGVLLIKQGFSLDTNITVPDKVKILGRGRKNTITMLNGSNLAFGNYSSIEGCKFVADAAFLGSVFTVNGNRARIKDCEIDLTAAANLSTVIGITVNGSHTRIVDTTVDNVSSTNKIGVKYVSGSDNADIDCEYT